MIFWNTDLNRLSIQSWRCEFEMENNIWLMCPVCGSKTRCQVRKDTVLLNYPLFCPKCKHETLISVKEMNITVIKEPDALDAEPINF